MSTLPPLFPPGMFDTTPLEQGYVHKIAEPFIADDVEEGPADVERAFVNAPTFLQIALPMDFECYEAWLGWLAMTGGNCAWHMAAIPRGDGNQDMKVRIRPGTLQPQLQDGEWIVAMQLETMDYRPWGETAVAMAILNYDASYTAEELMAGLDNFLAQIAAGLRGAGSLLS